MGRLLCAGAITATFVALAAIMITMMVARTGGDAARMPAEHRPDLLRLRADGILEPPLIRPGDRFRYGFQITNIGDVPLRNVAVRSERASTNGSSPVVRVLSVSDRMCAVNGQVNCLFPELPPGGSRSVRIEAVAPPASPAAPAAPAAPPAAATDGVQRLVLRTFVGCFVPGPAGGVDFSVIGDAQETVGRLAVTPSRRDQAGAPPADRAGGPPRDRVAGPSRNRADGPRRAGAGGPRHDQADGPRHDQADGPRRDRADHPRHGGAGGPQNGRAAGPRSDHAKGSASAGR